MALRHLRQENDELHAELDQLEIAQCRTGRPRRGSRPPGGPAGISRGARRSAHAGRARDRRQPRRGQPHRLSSTADRATACARDMGVITPEGVVGKVARRFPGHFAGAAAQRQGKRRRRAAGGLTHARPGARHAAIRCWAWNTSATTSKFRPGETVLTSGQDRIFPKDLPVGTVAQIKTDRRGTFQEILVQPAAHLDRLEEVLVLLSRQELEPKSAADTQVAKAPAAALAPKASASRPPAPPASHP